MDAKVPRREPSPMKSFRVTAAGLGVVMAWASAFPAIRVAAPAMGVAGLSIVRLTVAALALVVAGRLGRIRRPERRCESPKN